MHRWNGQQPGSTGTLSVPTAPVPGQPYSVDLLQAEEGEDSLGPSARAGSTDILSHHSFWLGFTRSLLISSGCGHAPYKLWPDMAEGQSLWSTYCVLDEERPSPTPLSRVPAVCTPNRAEYPDDSWPVETPSPIQDGMTGGCNKFYKVVSGDNCQAVTTKNNVTLSDFYTWNVNSQSRLSIPPFWPSRGSSCSRDRQHYSSFTNGSSLRIILPRVRYFLPTGGSQSR
jgi:hypothetical protein